MKRGSSGAKIPDLDEESDGGGGTTENMVDGGDDVDLEAVSLEQTTEKMDGGVQNFPIYQAPSKRRMARSTQRAPRVSTKLKPGNFLTPLVSMASLTAFASYQHFFSAYTFERPTQPLSSAPNMEADGSIGILDINCFMPFLPKESKKHQASFTKPPCAQALNKHNTSVFLIEELRKTNNASSIAPLLAYMSMIDVLKTRVMGNLFSTTYLCIILPCSRAPNELHDTTSLSGILSNTSLIETTSPDFAYPSNIEFHDTEFFRGISSNTFLADKISPQEPYK
nr:hypothetical protein TorRG33x02_074430 [Ipomoea batatas]